MMKIWKHSFQGLRFYGRFQKTIGKYLNSLKKLPKQGTLFSHPMTERTSYGVWLGSTLPAVWNPASPYGLFAKSVFLSGAMFSSFTRMKSSRSCRTGVSKLPNLIKCFQSQLWRPYWRHMEAPGFQKRCKTTYWFPGRYCIWFRPHSYTASPAQCGS